MPASFTAREMEILEEYRRLQRLPSGRGRARHYDYVFRLCWNNEQAYLNLLFRKDLDEKEVYGLFVMTMNHCGSVRKQDDLRWSQLVAGLKEFRPDLPGSVVRQIDWLERVHGY